MQDAKQGRKAPRAQEVQQARARLDITQMTQVIDKVLNDPEFRKAIKAHPKETLAELGIAWPLHSRKKPDKVTMLSGEFASLASFATLDATILSNPDNTPGHASHTQTYGLHYFAGTIEQLFSERRG